MEKRILLPVYGRLLLPSLPVSLPESAAQTEALEHLRKSGEYAVLVPMKAPGDPKAASEDDLRAMGVEARLVRTGMTGNGRVWHFACLHRVTVTGAVRRGDGLLEGEALQTPFQKDLAGDEERALLTELAALLEKKTGCREENVPVVMAPFLAFAAPYLHLDPDEAYALLQTDSEAEQGRLLKGFLENMPDEEDQAAGNGKDTGSGQGRGGSAKDYRALVESSGMPPEVRREVDQILNRYAQAQPHDPEKSSMESYLDFMTSLKWRMDETKEVDLKEARRILDRDHYGLEKVKERILQQIAVMTLKKDQAGSILLLIGPPGTGKTSMGRSIAETLGRKYARVSLGGVRDEAEIRGHRRTYVGAMPGRIMDGIKKAGSMNPVMVLDEIDKLAAGYQGDPASALLEVLDPEQNSTFTDHYMNVPYDLSGVFFICTANSLQGIPGPLLDRMEVITLSGYTPGEKKQIARKYLFPRALKDSGIRPQQLEVTDDALDRMIEEYTMEAGVRGLKKQLDILCRHTAAQIVEAGTGGQEQDPIVVDAAQLPEYLGNKRVIHDRALKEDQVGVVTGLAWTAVGGEILFIESRTMKGTGRMILTGQLGDVMKESATISLSLVRSLFEEECADFGERDIHIHVPSGSVPKDGPSAGVTMFTALSSLVTGRRVSRELAMTGEISLRGQVMPIGGLPEKLLAADRAGIKKVLIPEGNVQDLEDVPEQTREHLQIIPVSDVGDVLREALGLEGIFPGTITPAGKKPDGNAPEETGAAE